MGAARAALITFVVAMLVAGASLCCAGQGSDHEESSTTSRQAAEETQTVKLPEPRREGPMSLEAAIQARRSVREFTDEPLSLEEVGRLLWAAQGITSSQGARAAPSAGGTYPLEIYVAAGLVTGLEPGVYHYRPAGHELLPVLSGDVRARLAEASLDQAWVAEAAADVVIAAVYARTTEKYGERGIRYVHLEAGHAAENLCLQATALGLGAVTVGAFSDQELAGVLHVSSDEEPLYIIPVGRPTSP